MSHASCATRPVALAAAVLIAAALAATPSPSPRPDPPEPPVARLDEIPVFDPRCLNETISYLDVNGRVVIDGDLNLGTVAQVLRRSWSRALDVAARAVARTDGGPRLMDALPLDDIQKSKIENLARARPEDLPPGDPLRGDDLELAKRWVAFANEALRPIQRKRARGSPPRDREQASVIALGNGIAFLWDGGEIPFTVDEGTPAAALIPDAMKLWSTKTGWRIRFVQRDPTRHRDFVRFRRGSVCMSDGVGRLTGEQCVFLNENTESPQVVHELGHVIGLFHEHNRLDRATKIEFRRERVDDRFAAQFERSWVTSEEKALDRGSFDWDSVMLYPPFAFTKDGMQTLFRLDPPGRRGDTRWGLRSPGNFGGVTTEPSEGDATAVRNLYALLGRQPDAPRSPG